MSGGNKVMSMAFEGAMTPAATTVAQERRHKLRLRFGGPMQFRRAAEPEALILTIICALDMYTTLWWVLNEQATEANGNLAWTFHIHPALFVVMKCLSCLPALLMAPVLARRYPAFTTWLLRGIIVVYIGYYVMNVQ